MNMQNTTHLLEQLSEIARDAGAIIMRYYETDFSVWEKADASPVTAADERAEACILSALAALSADTPVVSEEAASAGQIPEFGSRFWLVDPLDGTKEFIGRNGEFTVNIALIEQGCPVAGVVYAPALNRMYCGARGVGAWLIDDEGRRTITCRSVPGRGMDAVVSRSHGDSSTLDAFLNKHRIHSIRDAGSSLKLCVVAAGEADLYPRLGRTMEWDIAAGHAVLAAAGGCVRTLHGEELTYGKPGLANPPFVASSNDATQELVLLQA